jgi:hypothetical protein
VIDCCYPVDNYKIDLRQYDLVVMGGGSLLMLDYWEDICIEAQEARIKTVVWGSGIDIRDEILAK